MITQSRVVKSPAFYCPFTYTQIGFAAIQPGPRRVRRKRRYPKKYSPANNYLKNYALIYTISLHILKALTILQFLVQDKNQ